MNLDNLKSRAREATINTLSKAMINSHCSIAKDGGVWTPKALAKSVGTQLPTMLAVEAVTGSLLTGVGMGFLADLGRMQVEGHLYAKEIMAQRDQKEARDQDAAFVPVNVVL
ncbi:MAG: hypothetical protein ACPHT7_05330 [Litorivicinaceae bacterium]